MDNPIMQGSTKKYDIPLAHLDFSYIRQCKDVKELEKIYRILKSNEEGYFPDLEKCCEEKILELNPNSRLLRKETPLFTKRDLDLDERQQIDEDVKTWSSDMKMMEGNVAGGIASGTDYVPDLPPVRSGTITLTAEGAKSSKPAGQSNKRVTPRDYREWDKIDVDKELEKVDEDDKKKKERTFVGNKEVINLEDTLDPTGLTEAEKLVKANREKDKGNEAFRSNDFKEAVTYYCRSICLLPTAASYNNRALAHLKLSQWHEAISDVNTVLKMEPDNVKALMRRGTAYKGLKMFEKARQDLEIVVSKEPNNKKAQEALAEITKAKEEKKKTGRRMQIEEVDEAEDQEKYTSKGVNQSQKGENHIGKGDHLTNAGNVNGLNEAKKPARRMKIEEVEDDDDKNNEIENHGERNKLNGNAETRFECTEYTIANNNSQRAKDIWNEDEVTKSNDNAITGVPIVEQELVASDMAINKSNSAHQMANGSVEMTNGEQKTESNQRSGSPVEIKPDINMSETFDSESKENKDSVLADNGVNDDDSKTPEVQSDKTEDNDVDEFADNEGVENDKKAKPEPVVQHVKRPVFYMTDYPLDCLNLKEEATTLFRSGQYGDAAKVYGNIIDILEKAPDQQVNLSLMYSNRAACHLKTGDLPATVRDCTTSLDIIPHMVKPLVRRASAYEHLERYKLAYRDYRHVLLLDSRVEQAHLGTKRCQGYLTEKDGPHWRANVELPKVNPTEIPDIVGLDGKSTSQMVYPSLTPSQSDQDFASTAQLLASSQTSSHQSDFSLEINSKSDVSSETNSQSNATTGSGDSRDAQKEVQKLSTQELFEKLKAEGNELVKQGKFKEAIVLYTQCDETLPNQTVVYTNRALCYIRNNQAKEAEGDCTRALALEKDNVKALFRRAQARKILKKHREGVEDLSHLLKVDPKNTAAKQEMEVLKNYWREELQQIKNKKSDLRDRKEDLEKETKPLAAENKPRKRMVIKEVESDEESGQTAGKETAKPPCQTSKQTLKQSSQPDKSQTKPTGVKSAADPSKEEKPKQISKTQSQPPKTEPKPVPVSKTAKKSSKIKETSTGFPSAPRTAPKLEKATPYEFISAWNALKKAESVQPYYDLLKQINPADIKTVISNKLDDSMLKVITRCVAEHFLPNDEREESFAILKHLSTVPRFGTVCMFMSENEKTVVRHILTDLETSPATGFTASDVTSLRTAYGV